MNGIKIFTCFFLLALLTPSESGAFPYRTSFEEPTFSLGTLDGQDGWRELSATGSGLVQEGQADGIGRGQQSVRIAAESAIARDFSSAGAQTVFVDGYYRGPTVSETPDPASIVEPGSSILLFHSEGIKALNGNGNGGGAWVDTGVAVVSGGLQRITIRQDYALQSWDLFIDGQPVLSGLGFKNTLPQLSGIDIETSAGGEGYLDDFAVTSSPPDFLARPAFFYFQSEWKATGTLNWDLAPVDPDGNVRDEDLIELIHRLAN